MVQELTINQIDCFECEYWKDSGDWSGTCKNILSPASGTFTELDYVCGFGVKQKPKPPELPMNIQEKCRMLAKETGMGTYKYSSEEIQCVYYLVKGDWSKIHYCVRECPSGHDIVEFAKVIVRK